MLERPHEPVPAQPKVPDIQEMTSLLSQRPITDPEVRKQFDLYKQSKNAELDALQPSDQQRALDIHEDIGDVCQMAGMYTLAFDHYDLAADSAKSFGDADRAQELRDKADNIKKKTN